MVPVVDSNIFLSYLRYSLNTHHTHQTLSICVVVEWHECVSFCECSPSGGCIAWWLDRLPGKLGMGWDKEAWAALIGYQAWAISQDHDRQKASPRHWRKQQKPAGTKEVLRERRASCSLSAIRLRRIHRLIALTKTAIFYACSMCSFSSPIWQYNENFSCFLMGSFLNTVFEFEFIFANLNIFNPNSNVFIICVNSQLKIMRKFQHLFQS